MKLTYTSINTSSISGTDGSIVLQLAGRLPPYTFLWSNSQTSDSISGLYQWDEMMQYTQTINIQGICPVGWHIPGDEEWKTMEMALGMSQDEADKWALWRGTDQGIQIKPDGSSGFEALLAGYRSWESPNNFTDLGIWRKESDKRNGYSVRCVTSLCDIKIITLIENIINVSCNGQSNGEIQITTLGGIPPYSYLWSNNANEIIIIQFPNSSAEVYKLILRDLSGKIYNEIDNITSNELNLETGKLPEEIYFIELRGTKIYRGKIIVE